MEVKNIKLFTEVDLSERNLPILIESGKEPGPTIWLCAGTHGDEVTGIETIHRIFSFLKRTPLKKGTLCAMPLINPLGFEMMQRENPYDNEDINRNYPGDPNGNTTERTTCAIFNAIAETKPDLVIDLHSDTQNSIPYIIIDRPVSGKAGVIEAVEKSWELAEKFGVTVTYDIEVEGYKKYNLDKSLTAALVNRNQIPAFLIELGGPKIIDEKFARAASHGIKNILRHFQMLDVKEKSWVSETKIKASGRLELIENITSNKSGIIDYLVKAGHLVKKDQALAKITNVLGNIEEIVLAGKDFYAISLNDSSVSFPGTVLLSAAAPMKTQNEENKTAGAPKGR